MMTTIASSSLFDDNLVQIKQEPQEDIWELASGGKNCSIIKSSTSPVAVVKVKEEDLLADNTDVSITVSIEDGKYTVQLDDSGDIKPIDISPIEQCDNNVLGSLTYFKDNSYILDSSSLKDSYPSIGQILDEHCYVRLHNNTSSQDVQTESRLSYKDTDSELLRKINLCNDGVGAGAAVPIDCQYPESTLQQQEPEARGSHHIPDHGPDGYFSNDAPVRLYPYRQRWGLYFSQNGRRNYRCMMTGCNIICKNFQDIDAHLKIKHRNSTSTNSEHPPATSQQASNGCKNIGYGSYGAVINRVMTVPKHPVTMHPVHRKVNVSTYPVLKHPMSKHPVRKAINIPSHPVPKHPVQECKIYEHEDKIVYVPRKRSPRKDTVKGKPTVVMALEGNYNPEVKLWENSNAPNLQVVKNNNTPAMMATENKNRRKLTVLRKSNECNITMLEKSSNCRTTDLDKSNKHTAERFGNKYPKKVYTLIRNDITSTSSTSSTEVNVNNQLTVKSTDEHKVVPINIAPILNGNHFRCAACCVTFSIIGELLDHCHFRCCKANLKLSKPFQCADCGKCYRNIRSLGRHKCARKIRMSKKLKRASPFKHYCPQCGRGYDHVIALKSHVNSRHNRLDVHECKRCNRIFFYAHQIKNHLCTKTRKIHLSGVDVTEKSLTFGETTPYDFCATIKVYKCKLCRHVSESLSAVFAHKREHCGLKLNGNRLAHLTGNSKLQCDTCLRFFSSNHSLRRHQRIHNKDYCYVCKFCDKKFTDDSNLQKHMKTHTGERPYGCHACSRRFIQSNDLKRHIKSVHFV